MSYPLHVLIAILNVETLLGRVEYASIKEASRWQASALQAGRREARLASARRWNQQGERADH